MPRVAVWALTIHAQVACRASWLRDTLQPWAWHGARVVQAAALCRPVQSSGQPNRHAAPRQTVMVQPPTRTWLLPHPGNELAMGTPCRQQGSLSQARRATGIASAGNRARVTSMATMYSATRPLMRLSILPPGIRSCRKQLLHPSTLRSRCHRASPNRSQYPGALPTYRAGGLEVRARAIIVGSLVRHSCSVHSVKHCSAEVLA